ncbi:MAG TPA: 3-carboxy-cis,cis-muconate cycloisomerase [Casimicrobiaceae bacterium]|nr:3-carboxy-cis,cis-muconate cycloisomerase [Casimicrobiaceae bacterium]
MSAPRSQRLLDPLFTTEEMREIFSDRGRLQGMLDFEAALARAEARAGMLSAAAAKAIGAECREDRFDVDALAGATALAGNPAIPLVRELTARVAASDAEAARFVHWGATSQDAMDTGLVLQLRTALDVIDADLARLSAALASLARKHARTPLAGRTWLQQGPPVTLGLKVAGWFSAVERHRERIARTRGGVATLQFGGAVGTLAALGERGLSVAEALAAELKLALPDLPWHAQRDRIAEVATVLGLLVGTLGKIARDVSLLMQTEIAEALEPGAPGRGGSSTMPHKRNPVGAAVMLAAAARVPSLVATMLGGMVQEHERGLGGWHAEWETLPEICMLSAGALARGVEIVAGLEVDVRRMACDLDITHGLIMAEAVSMALAAHLGRQGAHELVERACARAVRERKHLREVLAADSRVTKHLSKTELDRALDPARYTGQAEAFVARALGGRKAGVAKKKR